MAKPPVRKEGGVFISLGGDTSLSIDTNDNLWIVDSTHNKHKPTEVYLGKATKLRMANLQNYINRLAIHAVG